MRIAMRPVEENAIAPSNSTISSQKRKKTIFLSSCAFGYATVARSTLVATKLRLAAHSALAVKNLKLTLQSLFGSAGHPVLGRVTVAKFEADRQPLAPNTMSVQYDEIFCDRHRFIDIQRISEPLD